MFDTPREDLTPLNVSEVVDNCPEPNLLKEQSPYPEECGEIIYHDNSGLNYKKKDSLKRKSKKQANSLKKKISIESTAEEGHRLESTPAELHRTYR